MDSTETSSTRPYLIRALYEWCTDNGLTPHLAVKVNERAQVPTEFVRDGEIVLNIGLDATNGLQLGNDYIEFKARFGGVAREIMVPVEQVMAIYARENGQGMSFPVVTPKDTDVVSVTPPAGLVAVSKSRKPDIAKVSRSLIDSAETGESPTDAPTPPRPTTDGTRPALTRIK